MRNLEHLLEKTADIAIVGLLGQHLLLCKLLLHDCLESLLFLTLLKNVFAGDDRCASALLGLLDCQVPLKPVQILLHLRDRVLVPVVLEGRA